MSIILTLIWGCEEITVISLDIEPYSFVQNIRLPQNIIVHDPLFFMDITSHRIFSTRIGEIACRQHKLWPDCIYNLSGKL